MNGYFTWTQGSPTLTNIDIKIPFGKFSVITVVYLCRVFHVLFVSVCISYRFPGFPLSFKNMTVGGLALLNCP